MVTGSTRTVNGTVTVTASNGTARSECTKGYVVWAWHYIWSLPPKLYNYTNGNELTRMCSALCIIFAAKKLTCSLLGKGDTS